jgi:hypothetical protein
VHDRAFDNRFAAKEQQHLESPFSAAPCPALLTRLVFTRPVNIDRNHITNERLYISAWETFRSLVE